MPSAQGACNGAATAPTASNGAEDVLCLHRLSTNAPAHRTAISIAQFAKTLLPSHPSKKDMPGSTLQVISFAGKPAAQIAGPTAPWPSFAPLRPAAVTIIVVLVSGVPRRCHHPGKPVQAGGVLDLSLPMPAGCIVALLAMVAPPPLPPLVGGEDKAHSTNANSSPAALAHAVCRALKARGSLDRPLPAGCTGG